MNLIKAQVAMESKYNRKLIHARVLELIESSQDCLDQVEYSANAIRAWANKSYTDEKNARLTKFLNHTDLVSLCKDALAFLLVNTAKSDSVLFTAMAGMLGSRVHGLDKLEQRLTACEVISVLRDSHMCSMRKFSYQYYDKEDGVMLDMEDFSITCELQLPSEIATCILNTKYLPPMISKPRTIKANDDSGYYTIEKDSVVLNWSTNTKLPLDHLNRMNKQPLHLNVDFINDFEPIRPEFKNKYQAASWERFMDETFTVAGEIADAGNTFYLTHKFDKRVRTYSQGYHVNYQGASYQKAMVQVTPEHLTVEGERWLKIDIANHYGLDKEQFETRVEWFDANESVLESLAKDADDVILYTNAVMQWRKAMNGQAIGHVAHLDACASGTQLGACFTGCRKTATAVGLIGNKRMDIYSGITNAMNDLLPKHRQISMKDEGKGFCRNDAKQAFMTANYGSRATPVRIFGDATMELHAFYDGLRNIAPGTQNLASVLTDIWQPGALFHTWNLPDCEVSVPTIVKEYVYIYVEELDITYKTKMEFHEPSEKGVALLANTHHSVDAYVVREVTRRCNYNKSELEAALELINELLGA